MTNKEIEIQLAKAMYQARPFAVEKWEELHEESRDDLCVMARAAVRRWEELSGAWSDETHATCGKHHPEIRFEILRVPECPLCAAFDKDRLKMQEYNTLVKENKELRLEWEIMASRVSALERWSKEFKESAEEAWAREKDRIDALENRTAKIERKNFRL